MKKTTQSQFETDILKKQGKVVVDLYADWCQPCKKLTPILEKLSSSYEDVEFFAIDAETSMEIAERYSITSLPTILIFKAGVLEQKYVGLQSEQSLREKIDAI